MNDISYRYLREMHQREKNSPALCKIEEDFYQQLKEYFEYLEKEYNSIEDRDSPKAKLLKDEIENAKRIAESIYEQRERKILQIALVARKGGKPNIGNLITTEKELFESILKALKDARERIMENKRKNEKDSIEKKDDDETIVVRITNDIPEFVDSDMNIYNLKKEDVICLPKDIANALINKKVAEKGEIK
jgi:DNA replication initiation complex subunit (GINS family)